MAEPQSSQRGRPAGADVLITVQSPDPTHPPLPPAIAMGLFVSPAEQAHIDATRLRSWELAIARGHVRR